MKTWCENILTPINKLFTQFKKTRAGSQWGTGPPPLPQQTGLNAVETRGSSCPGERQWGLAGSSRGISWHQSCPGSGLLHLDMAEDPSNDPNPPQILLARTDPLEPLPLPSSEQAAVLLDLMEREALCSPAVPLPMSHPKMWLSIRLAPITQSLQ